MASAKSCKVCLNPDVSFHTSGNNPSFFCSQLCASRLGKPYKIGPSLHHDVIDKEHPLHGFVQNNAWLAKCIGETRADGSVKVTNKAAVQPLINYILIGQTKRSADDMKDGDGKVDGRKIPTALREDEVNQVQPFDPSIPNPVVLQPDTDSMQTDGPSGLSSSSSSAVPDILAFDNVDIVSRKIWEIPPSVVGEILMAASAASSGFPLGKDNIGYYSTHAAETKEGLWGMEPSLRKKVAFEIIKTVPATDPSDSDTANSTAMIKRELEVKKMLQMLYENQPEDVKSSFANMQEDGTGNTLYHYAAKLEYKTIGLWLWRIGASPDIKNGKGMTARQIASPGMKRQGMPPPVVQ